MRKTTVSNHAGQAPAHDLQSQKHADIEAIRQAHGGDLWAVAWTSCKDKHTADDIVQESFLRLWKQWASGEQIDDPRAWVMRVARNLAEDYRKSAYRRNGTSPPHEMSDIQSDEPSPLEAAVHNEDLARLREAMATLPDIDQQLLLRQANGSTCAELGLEFGRTPKAIREKLARARKRLRDRLL